MSRRTNQQLLTAALDVPGADVGVITLKRRDQVGEGQLVRRQPFQIRSDLVFLGKAADGVDLGHTRDVAQLRLDDPVLNHPQIRRCVGATVILERTVSGFHGPQENFAEAGGNRPHHRFGALGQLLLGDLQPLVDQLPGEEQVGTVLENHRDLRQPRTRQRTGLFQRRQTGHGGFNREGDALLGFQRREPGGAGVDLHLDIGDVGHGVDRQFLITGDPEAGHEQNGEQHDNALLDGKLDQAFEHENLPRINGRLQRAF